MKAIFLSLALSACAAPAYGLEVQLTDNKVITLLTIAQERIDNSKFEEDWWKDWLCQVWGVCDEPAPQPESGEKDYSKGIQPLAHDLQMANVPVLDQGQYGTCVTFASSAAVDAILAKGDYVSQQCSLAFNAGQGNNIWNGAYYPSEVIDPMKQYGVVSKTKCPEAYANPYQTLSVSQYQALVDKDVNVSKVNLVYKAAADLNAVKVALSQGHRVMIGFLLDGNAAEAVRGFDVLYAGQKYQGGLWACKQGNSANHCVKSNAGHEVVIVGYDDEQKILKIRNSWGYSVGASGDYFMSYEFFNKMVIDQTEVW